MGLSKLLSVTMERRTILSVAAVKRSENPPYLAYGMGALAAASVFAISLVAVIRVKMRQTKSTGARSAAKNVAASADQLLALTPKHPAAISKVLLEPKVLPAVDEPLPLVINFADMVVEMEKGRLGSGGSGNVYAGHLGAETVAVKYLTGKKITDRH